jgi:phage terminase small subunit
MALTEKMELFCQEYLLDFNATRAAKAAGYSEETAYSIGWENLRKPEIQSRIAELRAGDAAKLNLTRERILQEYSKLAFFDIRKIHTIDGAIKPVGEFDDDSAAAVAGIEVYEEQLKTDNPEEQIRVGAVKKIKIADKRAALDSICKVLGYNAADKHELFGKDGEALQAPIIQVFTNGKQNGTDVQDFNKDNG